MISHDPSSVARTASNDEQLRLELVRQHEEVAFDAQRRHAAQAIEEVGFDGIGDGAARHQGRVDRTERQVDSVGRVAPAVAVAARQTGDGAVLEEGGRPELPTAWDAERRGIEHPGPALHAVDHRAQHRTPGRGMLPSP